MISLVTVHWGTDFAPTQLPWLAALARAGEVQEIIVVDVESDGRLQELIYPLDWSVRVGVVCLPLVSVGPALNAGIREARGDWVLQINGDILPVAGLASAWVSYLEESPHVGMVGVDYYFGGVPDSSLATSLALAVARTSRAGLALGNYALSSRALWSRVAYDEGGPFATAAWGLEDNDLGAQIRSLGLEIHMTETVETPAGERPLRWTHLGVHASAKKHRARGQDVALERARRRQYLMGKWGHQRLADGHPWYWEREDEFAKPGAYSQLVVEEMRPDSVLPCELPLETIRQLRLEPPSASEATE